MFLIYMEYKFYNVPTEIILFNLKTVHFNGVLNHVVSRDSADVKALACLMTKILCKKSFKVAINIE